MNKKNAATEQPINQRSSLTVRVPNVSTREAIDELEAGQGTRFTSVKALMADLKTESK